MGSNMWEPIPEPLDNGQWMAAVYMSTAYPDHRLTKETRDALRTELDKHTWTEATQVVVTQRSVKLVLAEGNLCGQAKSVAQTLRTIVKEFLEERQKTTPVFTEDLPTPGIVHSSWSATGAH